MEEVKVLKEWGDGSIALSGDDFGTGRSISGGFYSQADPEGMHLTVYTTDADGNPADLNLKLDFDTVEAIRNQLDVWVVQHWPQE
jgi:hypothetical protein